MYARDHLPPHFHAFYSGSSATIGIAPLVLLEGRLSPRVLALIVEWATLHQAELAANWVRLERRQPAERIAPLE